jgi:hypothetical protein
MDGDSSGSATNVKRLQDNIDFLTTNALLLRGLGAET